VAVIALVFVPLDTLMTLRFKGDTGTLTPALQTGADRIFDA
jgi:hypothetical protein